MARMIEEERRAALLRHGQEIFAASPVDAMPMSEIAKQAGCSKALLYHYFGGRRGYYIAVLESLAAKVFVAMMPAPGVRFDEAFAGSLRRFLAFVRREPDSYRMVVQAGMGVDPEAQAVLSSTRDSAASLLRTELLRSRKLSADVALPLFELALRGWVAFAEASALRWVDDGFAVDDAAMAALLGEALAPVHYALASEVPGVEA